MTFKNLLAGVAIAASLVGVSAAKASTIIGSEDIALGFTGNFLEKAFPGTKYMVGSDGESAFHPFGATFDVSDALDFSGVDFIWTQAADSIWTDIGKQAWALPASTTCGAENEPKCEFVGHFVSPSTWSEGAIGTWLIMEADGRVVDDKIVTFNTAAGAELKFYSDPFGVPEASTWAFMVMGFGGLGAMLRHKRAGVAATA